MNTGLGAEAACDRVLCLCDKLFRGDRSVWIVSMLALPAAAATSNIWARAKRGTSRYAPLFNRDEDPPVEAIKSSAPHINAATLGCCAMAGAFITPSCLTQGDELNIWKRRRCLCDIFCTFGFGIMTYRSCVLANCLVSSAKSAVSTGLTRTTVRLANVAFKALRCLKPQLALLDDR